ncbi:MAG: hypothetical protein ACR2PG_00520, partial [Hyphomicrobiaceae bacterium]
RSGYRLFVTGRGLDMTTIGKSAVSYQQEREALDLQGGSMQLNARTSATLSKEELVAVSWC